MTQIAIERVTYECNVGRVHMVRYRDVRNRYANGELDPLQLEELAESTDANNCCSPDESYASVEEMLETIEAGWIVHVT